MVLDGFLASRDGRILLRKRLTGSASDPRALGTRLAHVLLDECGGRSLDDWEASGSGGLATGAGA
jgi:hypothetical protein